MAKIDSVCQYYLSTYGSSAASRYDTHKKSQLRDIYNRIVKLNKEAPLYKFQQTTDVRKFAIDIKEGARSIQNVVASLSFGSPDSIESIFQKKVAASSDESVVSAEYIGTDFQEADAKDFLIEVKKLASPQIHVGNFLEPNRLDLLPGTYSFDLNTANNAFEFQFNVAKEDTNDTVLHKLSRLFSNADVGLSTDVISDPSGRSALRIESVTTGLREGEASLFQIMPQTDSSSIHAMDVLGIDRVTTEPCNSEYVLNGEDCTALTNTVTADSTFRLTLHGPSKEGEVVKIGFKHNTEAVADNIEKLTNAYNHVLELGEEYAVSHDNSKFLKEMLGVSFSQKSSLESIGLEVDALGNIQVNRELLSEAVTSGESSGCFDILNNFKEVLSAKASNASLDPMNYVNHVVVIYKNPGKSFAAPYVTSVYSGMMLDRYC